MSVQNLPLAACLTEEEIAAANMLPDHREPYDTASRKGWEAACLKVPCDCARDAAYTAQSMAEINNCKRCGGTGYRLLTAVDVARVLDGVPRVGLTDALQNEMEAIRAALDALPKEAP